VACRPCSKSRPDCRLVLIADDNVDAGWGMAKLLEIAGFTTLCVKGGIEALAQTGRHKPAWASSTLVCRT
jgi:two-component system CheB/CheR fusion protein